MPYFHNVHIRYFVHVLDTSSVSVCGIHAFTSKTWYFHNIFSKNRFLWGRFTLANATKYLFCCVHFAVHADTVKMCLHSADSLHFLDLVPSGTVQRFRLLLDSTGGGGYTLSTSRGVSPPSTPKLKKPSSLANNFKRTKSSISPSKNPKTEKRPHPLSKIPQK